MSSINPSHYQQFDVSPIDLIRAYNLNFSDGNVVKYISRAEHKNGREDRLKALWYLLEGLGCSKEQIKTITEEIENATAS